MDAYLKSLRPVPSPYLVNGELSEKAKEGQRIFEKLKCGECHSGPYYTDMRMYRIGEDIEFEKVGSLPPFGKYGVRLLICLMAVLLLWKRCLRCINMGLTRNCPGKK